MHDIGGLFACREETPIRTAFDAKPPRLESGCNHRRRTLPERRSDKGCNRFAYILKHLLGGNVLCEVASSVRCHEHLRAYAGLAFEHKTAKSPVCRRNRREKPCGATTDNG